jgi:hypothetical protein
MDLLESEYTPIHRSLSVVLFMQKGVMYVIHYKVTPHLQEIFFI